MPTRLGKADAELADRLHRVREVLAGLEPLLVALSGGVDSSVLLALACRELGAGAVGAATGVSPSLARGDLEDARRIAAGLGVRHFEVATQELERPGYRANDGRRCLHCRLELFGRLQDLARREGFAAVAYGAVPEDLGDDRPGMAAAARLGIRAPLLEAGLSKAQVRQAARELGLPVADKPAAACLASRIPVGREVQPDALRQVERAEAVLAGLGFLGARVRHHGEIARLELRPEDLPLAAEEPIRSRLVSGIQAAGFRFVSLDLQGYRPGGRPMERDPGPSDGEPRGPTTRRTAG